MSLNAMLREYPARKIRLPDCAFPKWHGVFDRRATVALSLRISSYIDKVDARQVKIPPNDHCPM